MPDPDHESLDRDIEQVAGGAQTDDEAFRAWQRVLLERVALPCVGFGLCCWRLGRFDEAERVFVRMLWLNPSDNQGVRFLIAAVRTKAPWIPEEM